MTALPRTTATGRTYLSRFLSAALQEQPVHVYREPGKPGSGVSKPALDRLLADGLVELGEYVPPKGKPVRVTDLGCAVLADQTE